VGVVKSRVIALFLVAALGAPAFAEETARSDRDRALHALPVLFGAGLYAATESVWKESITPMECRWCEPNWLDTGTRNRLKWDRVRLANSASNLTGFVATPLLGLGLLVATTADEHDGRRWYDDTVPVLQSTVATALLNQTLKVIAGRRRPFATFDGEVIRPRNDFHTSFFSGHTALAFAVATSSGTVASLRGYRSASTLWFGGIALASATGYLRIAADAHYLSDVLTGAVIGTAIGVAIPLLFHRDVLTDDDGAVARTRTSDEPFMFSLGTAF
jgi:membrane-associated phospholipid phosphatase